MLLNLKSTTLLFCVLFLAIHFGYSQEKVIYPKGIYKTLGNFKLQEPSDTTTEFTIKIGNDTISNRFYNAKTGKRMRKEFAFSDGEKLYVNIKGMIRSFPAEDKGQLKDDGNYHISALQIGKKYIYFEDYFTSSGAAVLGGLIGASAARRLKGIVYDLDDESFNLFKNASDFEEFIRINHREYISELQSLVDENGDQTRKKHVEDLDLIRRIISDINSK